LTQTTSLTVAGLRRQDWAFFAAMFCAGGVVSTLAIGDRVAAPIYAVGLVVSGMLARRWSRMYPAPMPHAMRWILHVSHPGLSPRGLIRILAPRPGERLLEIGPGIGHHAFPIALALGPGGRLDVLDVQPDMLAEIPRRARRRGITNVVAVVGDAERLDYADAAFDGAYLVTVLGEIPRPELALRELKRVVKHGGRIVVGELFLDPDYIAPNALRRLAAANGLTWGRRSGSRFSYFARLDVA
jgi:SAM-dependent methyltransferase